MDKSDKKSSWGQVYSYGSNNLPVFTKDIKPSIGRFRINTEGCLEFHCCHQSWVDGSFPGLNMKNNGSLFVITDNPRDSFFIPYANEAIHNLYFNTIAKLSIRLPPTYASGPPKKDQINSITKITWRISPDDWGLCCFPQPYECINTSPLDTNTKNTFIVDPSRGINWANKYSPIMSWDHGTINLTSNVNSFPALSAAEIKIFAHYELEISFNNPIDIRESAGIYQTLGFIFEYFLGQKRFLSHPELTYGLENEKGTLFTELFPLKSPRSRCWSLPVKSDSLGDTHISRVSTLQYSWEDFSPVFSNTLSQVWRWFNCCDKDEYSVFLLLLHSISSKSENENAYEIIARYYSIFERLFRKKKKTIGKNCLESIEKLFKTIPEYRDSFNPKLNLNEWWMKYVRDCRKNIAHGSWHNLTNSDTYMLIDISHLAELIIFLIVSQHIGVSYTARYDLAKRALSKNTIFDIGLGVLSNLRLNNSK